MKYIPNLKNSFLSLASILGVVALQGCGGGGGGSSTPSIPKAPSPFDASYNATFVPSVAIPSDGQAPTGSIKVLNGRASLQTTFYLQPTVVTDVQKAIDAGLRDAGYAAAIPDNQVPATINFTATGLLDGSGKVILKSTKDVDICGRATLTLNPTFASGATGTTAAANYEITFPNNLFIELRGKREISGTCNNLPLRAGTVTFKP